MSRVCTLCNKKAIVMGTRVLLRGKYNPTKRSRKYPNLQWATLPTGGRIKVCTKCIKGKKHLEVKTKSKPKKSS